MDIIADWAHRLKHTWHYPIKRIWDENLGWCHEYKCGICNHVRKF